MKRVDVAIIGAGTAGISARNAVAKQTDNYLVIDSGPLGTLCARVGCMPSKALIDVAHRHNQIKHPPPGVSIDGSTRIDSRQVMLHVRKLRDHFIGGVLRDMESWQDGHLDSRRAAFIDPNTLDLEGERLQAKSVIIASGSRPVIPKPWHQFKNWLVTSDKLFDLNELPHRMIVIGLGPLGIELAQALRRLNVDIVALDPSKNIGGLTDPELLKSVAEYFGEEMTLCFEPAEIKRADAKAAVVVAGSRTFEADKILVAVGRSPVINDLGLENLGVPLDDNGMPNIDPVTLQVEDLPVFMAGDVNGIRPLLHEAAHEGRIAGHNAILGSPRNFDRLTPLSITFCSPQIARAGLTFRELKNSGREFVTGKASFENQGRALIMDRNSGHIRIYAAKHGGQLLGAELFAPGAEHLAHLVAWAIAQEMSVEALLGMPYYHPVLEESLRGAIAGARRLSAGSE